jgi:hypothetical protein
MLRTVPGNVGAIVPDRPLTIPPIRSRVFIRFRFEGGNAYDVEVVDYH